MRLSTRCSPSRASARSTRVAVAVGLGLALAAFAREGAAQADAADAADVAFQKGQIALEAGRLDEACASFEESLRLDVGVGALLNLARCHRLQGKILQSHREYGEAAELATKAGQADRAEAAKAVVAELGAVLPRLRIEVAGPVAGLAVTVDGRAVDASRLAEPLTLEVGPHEVAATAPGRTAWKGTADVRSQAEPAVLRIPTLAAEPQAAPPSQDDGSPGLVTAGIVLAGVGVPSLVVGSIFGAMTLSDASAAREDARLCPDEHCTPAGRAVVDDAGTKGIVSTIGIGVGVAAVAAGVILIVVGLPDGDAESAAAARLAPTAGPGDAGVGAVLRF